MPSSEGIFQLECSPNCMAFQPLTIRLTSPNSSWPPHCECAANQWLSYCILLYNCNLCKCSANQWMSSHARAYSYHSVSVQPIRGSDTLLFEGSALEQSGTRIQFTVTCKLIRISDLWMLWLFIQSEAMLRIFSQSRAPVYWYVLFSQLGLQALLGDCLWLCSQSGVLYAVLWCLIFK